MNSGDYFQSITTSHWHFFLLKHFSYTSMAIPWPAITPEEYPPPTSQGLTQTALYVSTLMLSSPRAEEEPMVQHLQHLCPCFPFNFCSLVPRILLFPHSFLTVCAAFCLLLIMFSWQCHHPDLAQPCPEVDWLAPTGTLCVWHRATSASPHRNHCWRLSATNTWAPTPRITTQYRYSPSGE